MNEPAPARRAAARRLGHLARRWVGSLSCRPLSAADDAWATGFLSPAQAELWRRMSNIDRRHAVQVARRFTALRPQATGAEVVGALLHDVGKIDAALGTFGRVIATVIGPRTRRLAQYHDHERIGAEALRRVGSDDVTVALVLGRGPAAGDLRAADDI